jgi:hypothetical protein
VSKPQIQKYVVPVYKPNGHRSARTVVTGRSRRYIEREIETQRSDLHAPEDWEFLIVSEELISWA